MSKIMTVEELIVKLMEFPLHYTVKLGDTDDVYPIEVHKSYLVSTTVRIGEDREPKPNQRTFDFATE